MSNADKKKQKEKQEKKKEKEKDGSRITWREIGHTYGKKAPPKQDEK